MLTHTYNSTYSENGGRRISTSRPVRAKLARSYLKNKIKIKGLWA
jgi:hypothetical protein